MKTNKSEAQILVVDIELFWKMIAIHNFAFHKMRANTRNPKISEPSIYPFQFNQEGLLLYKQNTIAEHA